MSPEGLSELVHRYLLLSESTRDILLFMDRDGAILEGNRAAEAAYGYARAELLTLSLNDLRDSRTHWQVPHQIAAAYQHGITFETWHRRKDGRIFPVEVSSVGSDYAGQRVILNVIRDITQRKRREAIRALLHEMDRRVLQSEAPSGILPDICCQLATTFDLALVRIGLKEPDGSVRIIATGGQLTEMQADLPVRWDQAPYGMGPTGAAMRTGRLQRSRLDDLSFSVGWQNQIRESGLREAVAFPIVGEGRVLGALTLYSTTEDVFDPEMLEHLHHFANQTAITLLSMERLEQLNLQRVALEAAANAVVITDRTGAIRWVNPAFTRVTGYAAAEAIGQTPRILNSGHHSRAFFSRLWRTILSGETWEGEIINRKKDGSLYVDEMIITPVRDKAGEISHFVVIKQDVTERQDSAGRLPRGVSSPVRRPGGRRGRPDPES